jgi:chromosome segregation ATPase
VYGNEIRIKRELIRNKGSTYKIQTAGGRNVQLEPGITSRKELERILDYFNIQKDNPCIMMTQDASREFLRDSNAKSKFLFFEKATLLHSMRTHNENSVERYDEMVYGLEDGKRTYADRQAKLKQRETRYHQAESYSKSQAELERLKTKI